jgi:hypothetical protein
MAVNPVALALGVVALLVSAVTRLNAVVLGRPVSVPYIGIIAVIIALALAVMVLYLVRVILRDGLRLRPAVTRA